MIALRVTRANLLWLALFLAGLAAAAETETLNGEVVSIADGDTITVLDSGRVQHAKP